MSRMLMMAVVGVGLLLGTAAPKADAHWRGGFWVGGPGFYGGYGRGWGGYYRPWYYGGYYGGWGGYYRPYYGGYYRPYYGYWW